jgi:hypothetical protein
MLAQRIILVGFAVHNFGNQFSHSLASTSCMEIIAQNGVRDKWQLGGKQAERGY